MICIFCVLNNCMLVNVIPQTLDYHNKFTVHCFFILNCFRSSKSTKKQYTVTALPIIKKLKKTLQDNF